MEVKLVENVFVCSGDEHGQASIPGHCPFQLRANTGLSPSEVDAALHDGVVDGQECHTSVRNEERWSRKLARRGGGMASRSGRFQRLPAHPLHREWSPRGGVLPLGIRSWSGSPA